MEPTTVPRAPSRPRTQVPHRDAIARVVSAYSDRIVRMYSRARFQIFRQRFLEEIGQYLPHEGRVLDIGCGFGLFALYFATRSSGRSVRGIDLSARRIETAREAAAGLGASNATFMVGDARAIERLEPFDAVYLLDVVHHIPKTAVPGLFGAIHAALPVGGILVVKELDTEPAWQRIFSHVLDVMMSPDSPPDYWPRHELAAALESSGFTVKRHALIDYLPYPHVLFVATKTTL